jgi:Family of unknown function (DUF6893)
MLRGPLSLSSAIDEVNTMQLPLIIGIIVLALILLAGIKMLPDFVRYMKIRSM